jgi:hypothetical protein
MTEKKRAPAPVWEQLSEPQAKLSGRSGKFKLPGSDRLRNDQSESVRSRISSNRAFWMLSTNFLQFLKGEGDVVGVSGMALLSPNHCGRPPVFSIVHGFGPTNLPVVGLQLLEKGFPILRHSFMQRNYEEGRNSKKDTGHRSQCCGGLLFPTERCDYARDRFAWHISRIALE